MAKDTFGRLDAAGAQVAKPVSRSVLGCMNDFAWSLESDLMSFDGLRVADIRSVNHRLRRAINSPNGRQRPVDLARARVGVRPKVVPLRPTPQR
ncbi:MAG: hypothetical protein HY814_03300 [Candidatus Riflebacteria bacterium]|nr:hypothetical protein [Candidatus Riflebacteria bacterium]